MALIKCIGCNEQFESSFFDFWTCSCGWGSWRLDLLEYSPSEVQEVFKFFSNIKKAKQTQISHRACRPVVLAKELETPENDYFQDYIDILLLIFDGIVIPDMTKENLIDGLGYKKSPITIGTN